MEISSLLELTSSNEKKNSFVALTTMLFIQLCCSVTSILSYAL